MNITFYLRGKSVYIDIYHQDFRIQKPTGRKAASLSGTTIKGNKPDSNLIASIKTGIEDFERDCIKAKKRVTEKMILQELERLRSGGPEPAVEEKPFWDYYDQWVNESKNRISEITGKRIAHGTIKRYTTTKSILQAFELKARYILSAESINDSFYSRFRDYIIGSKKQSVNTFSDHIKQVKAFCKWLQKKEPSLSNDFRDFKKPFSYADAEPLKETELLKLYDYKAVGYKDKAKLIFLFLCSTGVRISDYNKLEEKNFMKDHIFFKAQKTNAPCYVPFYDDLYFRPEALKNELIEKFGSLPRISGQKLNEHIKEIFKDDEVKITRIIPTSKTGRKTFATLKLLQQVPPEVIMKSTGHKERASFDAYVGIDTADMIKQYKDKAIKMKIG
jgi:integrase